MHKMVTKQEFVAQKCLFSTFIFVIETWNKSLVVVNNSVMFSQHKIRGFDEL